MVKINEFNDMDIPKEIVPKPDYDVPSDLLIFMRNDPMFYRKNFFPAVEKYRENKKDTSMLEKMCETGLIEYCKKFNIENTKDELLGDGDMKSLVQQIITDEMEDLEEGVMDFAKKVGNYVMHGGKDPFNDYMAFAKRRLQVSDPRLLAMMQRQFPKAAPADLARAIAQARKAAA